MANERNRTSGIPGHSASSVDAARELEKARLTARHLSRLLDLWACGPTRPSAESALTGCKCEWVNLQLREETGVG